MLAQESVTIVNGVAFVSEATVEMLLNTGEVAGAAGAALAAGIGGLAIAAIGGSSDASGNTPAVTGGDASGAVTEDAAATLATSGTVTIIDFDGGTGQPGDEGDQLDLSAFSFADFAAVQDVATPHGPGGHDTLLTLDADTFVVLEDVPCSHKPQCSTFAWTTNSKRKLLTPSPVSG